MSAGNGSSVVLDGDTLQARRRELGLTQVEAADMAQITRRTLQSAEGGRPVSVFSAHQLGMALGLPFVVLLHRGPSEIRERLTERGYAPVLPPSPWSGRRAEAERLLQLFSAKGRRALCSIAGPTGIGKTALARYVAARLASSFPDGVVWVAAARVAAAGGALVAQLDVAEALGFASRLPDPSHVDAEAFDRAFQHQLFRRRRLLILDDVADPRLAFRYTGERNAAWLLTTTSHWTVARAIDGITIDLGPLSEEESVELLAAHVGAERLAADSEGARALVRLLGGVPRGLQIAGRVLFRERFITPGEYALRVAESLQEPTVAGAPRARFTRETGTVAS